MKQTTPTFNSVEKALKILKAFEGERPYWGVRELSTHLGFSPATVQRILQTLKSYAFVDQDAQTRQYRLGNIYFSFLHSLQRTYPVTQAAQSYMMQLLSRTQETVHLNVIERNERICIDNRESSQNLKGFMPVGSRSPLYAGASSKCLLAFSGQEFIESYLRQVKLAAITKNTLIDKKKIQAELETIRKQGYAASLGERNPGLGSLSAPILDYRGSLLASISLAIPEMRYRDQKLRKKYVRELLLVAKKFSEAMGARDAH
ncbi:MAG: IclR family transcriptional regulator [Desulfobacterales bacterium]|nr:IclR family transcriptional regulator [Desulfobacterales bacterium]